MIFTERTIKIANDVCKIDDPIVLYRGDYNVEIRFTIIECPYKYSTKNSSNIIETVDASYGQLVIKVPNGGSPIFSDVVETKEGSIVFTLSGEMIDESIEVGDYTFQIRLFDANRESRVTIPPVENGISIREPIAFEDATTTNEVGKATVGYALTPAGTAEDTFDSQGNYNKTTWETGDRITTEKLNKIEQGITGVNNKVPHYNETLKLEISGADYSSFMNNNYFNINALNIDETKSYIFKVKMDINSDEEIICKLVYDKTNNALIDEISQTYIYNHKSYDGTNFIEDENSAVITLGITTFGTGGGTEEADGYFRLYEIDKVELDANCLPDNVSIKNSLTVGTRIGDIGLYSVAEGKETTASGECSHAEGEETTASGECSHAEGVGSIASGMCSHAEGIGSTASGMGSHAEGDRTIASSENQHVQGRNNIEDTENKYAHIVGNGMADTARSNAHTLDWQGNGWYQGKLSQNGTPTEDKDLTTKKYVDDAIGNIGITGGSNINDTTASATTTYSSNKIESIKENLSSQITTINNNIQNIGNPTDEQVKNVINEAIANGDIVAGGLTSTAQTLLVNILRSAVFTSDQSANITLLQSELAKGNSGGSSGGGSETTRYTITNTLNNATTSNSAVLVDANSSYTAIIRENDGYTLDTITVTMGDTDITSSVVSGTTITITSVTGNVVITVTTTESGSSSGGEMVTDGLVDYFDFRTVTEGTLSDGQTSILPTTGSGCFYSWGHINSQGEYGAKLASNVSYSANGTNSQTNCGTSFTWVFKSYMESAFSPLFSTTHAKPSNISKLNFTPKYNTSSSAANCAGVDVGGNREAGYQCFIMTVNGNECKLYYEGVLVETKDGSTLTDFISWDDKLVMGILGGKANGYVCQVAIYNRALTDVEVVETNEYLKTLEVSS